MATKKSNLPFPLMTCPLDEADCQLLTDTLKDCHDVKCYLEKLQAIGVDFSDLLAEVNGNADLAAKLKAVHFPEAP